MIHNKNDFENRLKSLENKVSKLENIIYSKPFPKKLTNVAKTEKILIEQIKHISITHLVVISLKWNQKQTREEIKKTLEDWGKVVGNWFSGGNLNNRLVKINIVKRDGTNEKNYDIFSLTKKGELLANQLIKKITENPKNDTIRH